MPSPWCSLSPCAFTLSHRRQAKVVLVGSSSEVLRLRLGSVIDQHDTVVRTNCAPVQGFEEHVGGRTSFRVINEQSEPFGGSFGGSADAAASIVALPIRRRNSSSDYATNVPAQATCRPTSLLTGHRSAFVSHEFIVRLRDDFGVIHPTTGFMAIALFSRLFTRPVALHGYSFFAPGTQHYWIAGTGAGASADLCGTRYDRPSDQQAIRQNANLYHNASREREIIERMTARGILASLSVLIADGLLDQWMIHSSTAGGERKAVAAGSADDVHYAERQPPAGPTTMESQQDTCLTGCIPRRERNAAREGCRWPSAPPRPPTASATELGDVIFPASPELVATGCLPSPSCCSEFKRAPRHQLFRKRPDGSFYLVGRGHCHQGFYAGWKRDPPELRANLTACQRQCAAEPRCAYVAFVQGASCSRYDERAGVACCPPPRGRAVE